MEGLWMLVDVAFLSTEEKSRWLFCLLRELEKARQAYLPQPSQRGSKPPKICACIFLTLTQKLWPWSLHRRKSRLCHCSFAVGKTAWTGGGSWASCSRHSLFFIVVQFIAQGTTKVNSALFNIWRAPVYRQLTSSIGFSRNLGACSRSQLQS